MRHRSRGAVVKALAWWRHLIVCAWHRMHGSPESARREAELARFLVRDADTRMRQRTLDEIERRQTAR